MNGAPPPPDRTHVDHERGPCPHRIVDDAGGAFAMGAVGGSVWHFVRGAHNSPRGARLAGAVDAVKLRAPVLGGSFAGWAGLYSLYDCGLSGVRGKEDPWNSIASGALAGATLSLRSGMKIASRAALAGGVILALIEGMGIVINRYAIAMSNMPQPPPQRDNERPTDSRSPADGLAGVATWAAEAQ